jgi:hypothetical protein
MIEISWKKHHNIGEGEWYTARSNGAGLHLFPVNVPGKTIWFWTAKSVSLYAKGKSDSLSKAQQEAIEATRAGCEAS